MALPQSINPATPVESDSTSLGDNQLRQLKTDLIDVLGLPSATDITAPYLVGGTTGIRAALFADSAAASTTAGRLQRNGKRLVWGAGDQSGDIAMRAPFVAVTGNSGGGADVLTTPTPTISAGFFTAVEHAVLTFATGAFAANGNTKTLRFHVGSASVSLNPAATPAPNGLLWFALIVTHYTALNAQLSNGIAVFAGTGGGGTPAVIPNLASTEDQTTAIPIYFSGESGSSASNDIVQHIHLQWRM